MYFFYPRIRNKKGGFWNLGSFPADTNYVNDFMKSYCSIMENPEDVNDWSYTDSEYENFEVFVYWNYFRKEKPIILEDFLRDIVIGIVIKHFSKYSQMRQAMYRAKAFNFWKVLGFF